MSALKKCCCDYKPLQSFAARSIPAPLNVHEGFSFISSRKFKPFIERPKYFINSQAFVILSMLSTFSISKHW